MKLFLSFLIITGLGTPSCLGFMEELDSIDMTFMLPIMYRPLKDKPEHGICFQETSFSCAVPGERVESFFACLTCFCSDRLEVFCCREEPYPVLKDPSRCKLTLQPNCLYKRHPRCKDYCSITGWYYSDVSQVLTVPMMQESVN
ncbi:hypothetical protein BSL78_20168 [Apostichopus japonicus]|uniref:Uncharacterized protein n=1 Tax=Stichopus japonicus TaxID=307972 RepID=A0A2G8K4P4_STIJA|nr:hypothetical protein BSL78_20168 [Apostichopus japonicus]